MQIEYIDIGDITPYPNNPRKNDDAVEVVAKSIQEFGFKVPIVVDADNTIITGHTRYKAADKLGMETIPIIRADDLTPEQVRAFRIIDNKTAEFSFWDMEKLNIEMDSIISELPEFSFEEFGLAHDSIAPVDINEFFETPTEVKEKEPKRIQCPHCGEWIEI